MSTTTEQKAPTVSNPNPTAGPFTVPKAEVGQLVYWYPHGTSKNQPHAAFVTKMGHDSLCLSILHPNSHNFMLRDGVRHISDPRAKQADLVEQGGWEHAPATKRIQQLEEQVARLSSLIKP